MSLKIVTLVGIALALAGAVFISSLAPNQFARVPGSRDPRLVGTWNLTTRAGRNAQITFSEDGTGTRTDRWAFKWGTRDGSLVVKMRSSGEGYVLEEVGYRFALDGAVEFSNRKHTFILPEQMRRAKPALSSSRAHADPQSGR